MPHWVINWLSHVALDICCGQLLCDWTWSFCTGAYYAITMIISADIQQQYIGCYKDGGAGNRVLTGSTTIDASLTVERCELFCQQTSDTYFGVEVITLRYSNCIKYHSLISTALIRLFIIRDTKTPVELRNTKRYVSQPLNNERKFKKFYLSSLWQMFISSR